MPERPINPLFPNSNLSFHLWVERIAWAIAREEGDESFFVPEHGIYRKKLNIVNDEAMWHCFRLHIFTKRREIGVIGVRRKFIPPSIDTFQDMVFVLKGVKQSVEKRSNEPNFMQTLEQIVDSLSPTVMDWKWNTTWVGDLSEGIYSERRDHNPLDRETHPTYVDKFMIQTQANALMCSNEVYSWLKNRPKFRTGSGSSSTRASEVSASASDEKYASTSGTEFASGGSGSGKALIGIVPKMKFQGQTTHSLAEHFCDSILQAIEGDSKITSVKDPLSIIKRINTAAMEMLDPRLNVKIRPILLNNWKRRVSLYFGHMVASYQPDRLTIGILAKSIHSDLKGIAEEDKKMLDRVLAFLLFMHKEGDVYKQPKESIFEQLQDSDMMSKLECNEDVLIDLLQTDYFEKLKDRNPNKGDEVLSLLIGNLLVFKSHNLKLLRVVCKKARQYKPGHKFMVRPLIRLARGGNTYAKTYALHALRVIAEDVSKTQIKEIYDLGGVQVGVNAIQMTPSRDLLQTSVGFLEVLVDKRKDLNTDKTLVLTHHSFLNRLVSLLKKQQLGQRHDSSLLAAVSRLILQICPNPNVLYYLVVKGVIKELMDIVGDYRNYFKILIPVTVTLGTIFHHLTRHMDDERMKQLLFTRQSALQENLSTQSETLVGTLKHCTTREGLQVAVNILIALSHIITLDERLESDSKESKHNLQGIMRNLMENHGLEHALIQAKTTANNVLSQVNGDSGSTSAKRKKVWTTIINGVQRKAGLLLEQLRSLKTTLRQYK